MQNHSIRAATANFLKYRIAGGRQPTTGVSHSNPHQIVLNKTLRNSLDMDAYGQGPKEVRHALIDYRNGNEELATKCMDRRKAFALNARLKDTGMAWAVKTGY
jgi:hypothetical protein